MQLEEKSFGPIRFLPGRNKGKYPRCHSVFVEGPGVLIDPACNRRRLVELRDSGAVREIWLTHWHEDHFKNLDLFEDLPLRISRLDAPPLSDMDLFMEWYGFDTDLLRSFVRGFLEKNFHFRPRVPTRTFENGETIDLGEFSAEVIPAPGHTPGHVAFFFPELSALVMGDYTLNKFGPWYGDRDASIEETIATVERLRGLPAEVWITAHGDGFYGEDPDKLWDEYLAVIGKREEKYVDFLAEPRTLGEIADQWIVNGRVLEPASLFQFGERATAKKHLERMMRRGRVALDGDRYVLT